MRDGVRSNGGKNLLDGNGSRRCQRELSESLRLGLSAGLRLGCIASEGWSLCSTQEVRKKTLD
jgi:hypothetical protein